MSKQAYKFRLYPTRKQEGWLIWTLDRCRELYNASLQERRDAYNFHVKQHPNYYDEPTRKQLSKELSVDYCNQAHQLSEIKAIRPEYHAIYSQVLQDVMRRTKKAFDAFFRRVREGGDPGYPRFQGKGRYDSFTYPQSGYSLTHDKRVSLAKLARSKSKCIGRSREPSKPVLSNVRVMPGMWSSLVKWSISY